MTAAQTKRSSVETSIILFADRFTPPSVVAEQARALEASGVVDYLETADQLVSFFPDCLWTAENAPLAKLIPDLNSCSDCFVMAAYCLAAAPRIGLTISTDAIRHAPAEFTQTMMTFSNITNGKAMFQIGGGEAKQAKPYGWKRAEGLARMEDLFKFFHAIFDNEKPFDLQGNHTTFTKAYLGSAKQHRPKLWGLGGGPKLIDLVTTYADGLSASAPSVWATPDEAHEEIESVKRILETKGRDPKKFGFGAFCPVLIHEDPAVIDKALDNPLVRWFSAVTGRVDPAAFRREGIEPAVPEGWNYFMKMLPNETTPEFANEVVSKTTRKMAERSFMVGSPKEVAAQLRGYVDAGLTWILPFDVLPLVLEPEDAARSLKRSIDVCAYLKGVQPTA